MQPPWMNEHTAPFQTITLERLAFAVYQAVGRELIEDLANPIQVERLEHYLRNEIVFRIRMDIAAQHLDRAVVRHPLNWREAVKQAFYHWCSYKGGAHWPWFGDYGAARWPVREKVVTIDVKALYPKIALKNERHTVVVMREEEIRPWWPTP